MRESFPQSTYVAKRRFYGKSSRSHPPYGEVLPCSESLQRFRRPPITHTHTHTTQPFGKTSIAPVYFLDRTGDFRGGIYHLGRIRMTDYHTFHVREIFRKISVDRRMRPLVYRRKQGARGGKERRGHSSSHGFPPSGCGTETWLGYRSLLGSPMAWERIVQPLWGSHNRSQPSSSKSGSDRWSWWSINDSESVANKLRLRWGVVNVYYTQCGVAPGGGGGASDAMTPPPRASPRDRQKRHCGTKLSNRLQFRETLYSGVPCRMTRGPPTWPSRTGVHPRCRSNPLFLPIHHVLVCHTTHHYYNPYPPTCTLLKQQLSTMIRSSAGPIILLVLLAFPFVSPTLAASKRAPSRASHSPWKDYNHGHSHSKRQGLDVPNTIDSCVFSVGELPNPGDQEFAPEGIRYSYVCLQQLAFSLVPAERAACRSECPACPFVRGYDMPCVAEQVVQRSEQVDLTQLRDTEQLVNTPLQRPCPPNLN